MSAQPAYSHAFARLLLLLASTHAVLAQDPQPPAGPANPIEHVVVIMQENHSFDSYFGMLTKPQFYGSEVDGITAETGFFRGSIGYHPFHISPEGVLRPPVPGHSWPAMRAKWNSGLNDRFTASTMCYYDETELPYYYGLANSFAIADRYFSPMLGPTFPNRFYLFAGTSFGLILNQKPPRGTLWQQRTVFDLLDDAGVTWKYYTDGRGYLRFFAASARTPSRQASLAQFATDLAANALPQVVFLESDEHSDEHPRQDVRVGQAWVAARIDAIMASPAWPSTAIFLTYDEAGGFYDHVPPPAAVPPDAIPPKLRQNPNNYAFDRLGFRVPFILVSPYARRHFVSHTVYDHTSILKFIETRFGLPALTARDAAASDMTDLFDFSIPN